MLTKHPGIFFGEVQARPALLLGSVKRQVSVSFVGFKEALLIADLWLIIC